jgi:hypothetical protein
MVTVKLEIPDELAKLAREVSINTRRPVEAVLIEWLDRASNDLPVDSLSDDEILALCDLQMNRNQQKELSNLLAKNREGQLDVVGRERLEVLMAIYQKGLVRKSEALRVAVQRGIRQALS